MLATQQPEVKNEKYLSINHRDYRAPDDLRLSFDLPESAGLHPSLLVYNSCKDWLPALKKATAKAYQTHLRLFCRFWHTDPGVLLTLSDEQLKEMLDKYLSHLNRIAVRVAGKPKPGRLSVNSIPLLFTGLHDFLVKEHEREINWSRLERKFPERVKSTLRGYYREEVQKLYKNADVWDKPIVLLEFCTWVRVGAIGAMRFEDLTPNPDLPGTCFLGVYPDSERDNYHVLVTEEFQRDLQDLKELRERWGEKITPQSYLFCKKYGPRSKIQAHPQPLSDVAIRRRIRKLMKKCGLDMERLQPNHGNRNRGPHRAVHYPI